MKECASRWIVWTNDNYLRKTRTQISSTHVESFQEENRCQQAWRRNLAGGHRWRSLVFGLSNFLFDALFAIWRMLSLGIKMVERTKLAQIYSIKSLQSIRASCEEAHIELLQRSDRTHMKQRFVSESA